MTQNVGSGMGSDGIFAEGESQRALTHSRSGTSVLNNISGGRNSFVSVSSLIQP